MNNLETLKPLAPNECQLITGGSLVSVGRWVIGAIGGGALYDGVKSGASSAYTAWNSMSARIIGSHYKIP